MKKQLIAFSLFIFMSVALCATAFASSISASPNPVTTGSESTVTLTYTTAGFTAYFYLFDPAGNNISGNSNASHPTSPISWTTAGFGTSLTPGAYTAGFYDNANNTFTQAQIDGACGVGTTLSGCIATTQYIHTTTTISAAPAATSRRKSTALFAF
jgi:hypothetical protein